jgi:glycosyltransferase involved in cell wall biosynthesis
VAEWLIQEQFSSESTLAIAISGRLEYLYFVLKYLLRSQINFRVSILDSIEKDSDFLVDKFREFVRQVSQMDYSDLSSQKTFQYPNAIVCCSSKECKHSQESYLEIVPRKLGISVVIPTRNTSIDWIRELFHSVTSQIGEHDEIILIDDNDETQDFSEFIDNVTEIKIIEGKKEGVSSARNLGLVHAAKELVLFIDSDDNILNGFIEEQRSFHEKYNNVSATGVWLQAFGSHDRVYPQWDGFSPIGVMQCLPPAGVLMWKRKALLDIGDFKDEFATGFEDFDLVARAISENHLIVTIDEILYMYRRGHVSLTSSLTPVDQTQLFKLVWRNGRNLCENNFIEMLDIALQNGEQLYFDSINYMFLSKKKKRYLNRLTKKARNVDLVRKVWVLIPLTLRRKLFNFAIKH